MRAMVQDTFPVLLRIPSLFSFEISYPNILNQIESADHGDPWFPFAIHVSVTQME